MAIVSGYQKMKDYIKQSSGYKLLSRWANANTVECDDAQTVQSKIGGITGISSSLTANSSTQAASTQLTNQLYQNMNKINVYVDDNGDLHYVNAGGADSVIPFSSVLIDNNNEVLSFWKSFYIVEVAAGSVSFSRESVTNNILFSGSSPVGAGTKFQYAIFNKKISFSKVKSITIKYSQHSTTSDGAYGYVYPTWLTIFKEDTDFNSLNNIVSNPQESDPMKHVYANNILQCSIAGNTEGNNQSITIDIDTNDIAYIGFCFMVGPDHNEWIRIHNIILNK